MNVMQKQNITVQIVIATIIDLFEKSINANLDFKNIQKMKY